MSEQTIICGDSLEIMRGFKDKQFDLVLTDPPYGIGAYKNGTMGGGVMAKQSRFEATTWDDSIPSREYFDEMRRVSKNQIIFGGNYFIEYLSNSPCWVVWDKDNGDNYFADAELAWTSFDTAVRKFRFRWQGMLQEDMKNKEHKFHPTQKPIEVMRFCLENYSEDGQTILDPFAGGGSTILAAKQLQRAATGIEINPAYAEIARKRLENQTPPLF